MLIFLLFLLLLSLPAFYNIFLPQRAFRAEKTEKTGGGKKE